MKAQLLHSCRLAMLLALAACSRDATAPAAQAPAPALAISDGAHQGNPHFFFLEPITKRPPLLGVPDSTVQPQVVICEFVNGGCGAVVAVFNRTTGVGRERLEYASAGHFEVEWTTDKCMTGPCTLDPAKTYRLRVLVGAVELGYADLDVVATRRELRNVRTNEFIPLLNGKTLEVEFAIEKGAVSTVSATGTTPVGVEGADVSDATGTVALHITPGALQTSTPIGIRTIPAPATGVGDWAPVVDLGPNGQQFSAPVDLKIQYDPSKLPSGVPSSALAPVYFDGTGWQILPGGVIDSLDNTVTVPIQHFSTYSISIRPNSVRAPFANPQLLVGDSTSFVGVVWAYDSYTSTYCYWTTYWWFRQQVCQSYQTPISYQARNMAVQWYSAQPPIVSVAPGSPVTYTDATGTAISPAFIARSLGSTLIFGTAGNSSASWTVDVIPKLSFTVAATGTVPTRRLGLKQATSLFATIPAPLASPLTVTLTHTNAAVASSNPTAVIAAGSQSQGTLLIAGTTVGADTVIGRAPGYAPDTLVVTTGSGKVFVTGLPATLALGDSAPVTIRPMNSDSTVIDNGYGLTFALATNGKLAFSRASAPISSITLPDGSSFTPTFYIRAMDTGAARMTVTNAVFDTAQYTINVTPPAVPPVIDPNPQAGQQLLIALVPGSSGVKAAPINNAGGGTLGGLQVVGAAANCYTGSPTSWLSFAFDYSGSTPIMRVSVSVPAGTAVAVYDFCYTLRAPGAADRPYGIRVSVQEVVVANPPFINPNPQGPQQGTIAVRAGESGNRAVPVTNAGAAGSVLDGLALVGPVRNCYTGEVITWLSHAWVSTTAPTTLTLTATPPASLAAGTYDLCFQLQARLAGAMDYGYGVRVLVDPAFTLSLNDLGVLGGSGTSVANAINSFGRIVGYSNGSAVQWTSPSVAPAAIPNPYGDLDYAFGVNEAGLIIGRTPYVGWIYDPASGAFQTAPGAFPVTNRSWGFALNNSGIAIACSDNGAYAQNYVWNVAAATTTLIPNAYNWCDGRINDAGLAIVSQDAGNGGRALLHNAISGTTTLIPTFGSVTVARAINASSVIVGTSRDAVGRMRAFRYTVSTGEMLDLGTLGGGEAEALGINDAGWIVGWSLTASGARHAFARNPASGWMYDLGVQSGNDQSVATAITSGQTIVGFSSVGTPGGLGGQPRTVGVFTGTTRATVWTVR